MLVMNLVREEGADPLLQALALLQGVDPWEAGQIEADLVNLLAASGLKPDALLDPLHGALDGDSDVSGIYERLEGLGREETLRRLEAALANGR